MPTNHYDLIVLGDDFSGLVAATLCARRGLRVLLAQSSHAPASYQLGPYRLPTEPLHLVGLSSPAVRRVLDELHFQHLLKRKLRHAQPYQLVGPDARIAVDLDDAALAREIERELGAGSALAAACDRATQIAALLDPVFSLDIAVPPTGFWERREVGRTASRLSDEADAWDRELGGPLERAFFTLPALFGAEVAPDSITPVARARAFADWRQGLPRLPGDWDALRAIFLDKFTSHNGELRVVEVESLASSWGKVTGLKLDGGEELGASHVIAAMPAGELAALCERKLARRLAEIAEASELGAVRYTLNLVLDEVGIPEGMGQSVLVVGDPEAPLTGDNALAITVDQPDGEARVAVTVQAICPRPPDGGLDDALANLRVGLRERLEMVMPFYAEHVRVAHSPHESAPAESRDRSTGDIELAQLVEPHPLWHLPPEPLLGVAGLGYQPGIKQLTLASHQILPGLGLEGAMTAGWCAAKLACEALGKKKDYLKDEVLTVGRS
jgi:hypothetical protein